MSSEAVAPPELQSAGIWRRFMSMVYEGIMLFGVLFSLATLFRHFCVFKATQASYAISSNGF